MSISSIIRGIRTRGMDTETRAVFLSACDAGLCPRRRDARNGSINIYRRGAWYRIEPEIIRYGEHEEDGIPSSLYMDNRASGKWKATQYGPLDGDPEVRSEVINTAEAAARVVAGWTTKPYSNEWAEAIRREAIIRRLEPMHLGDYLVLIQSGKRATIVRPERPRINSAMEKPPLGDPTGRWEWVVAARIQDTDRWPWSSRWVGDGLVVDTDTLADAMEGVAEYLAGGDRPYRH